MTTTSETLTAPDAPATQTAEVTIFSTPGCAFCRTTAHRFTKQGVLHNYVCMDAEQAAQMAERYAARSAPIVVIEHADGTETHWSGMNPDLILQAPRLVTLPTAPTF